MDAQKRTARPQVNPNRFATKKKTLPEDRHGMPDIEPVAVAGKVAGRVDRWMKGSYDIGKKQSRRNNLKEKLDSLTTSHSPRVLAEGLVEY